MRASLLLLALPFALALAACNQTTGGARPVTQPVALATPRSLNASFAEDSRGTVIPDAVRMGMTECELIAGKGTPSRMVAGLDQSGGTHDAVWYIEGGARTVYKFDNDQLIDVIH